MFGKHVQETSVVTERIPDRTTETHDGLDYQSRIPSNRAPELHVRERIDNLEGQEGIPERKGETHKKTHVLLVITKLDIGGATKVVLAIADYLSHRPNFDVEIVAGPVPDDRTDMRHVADELGIPLTIVPSLVNRISPMANLKATMNLWRVMVENDYDIVHTHSSVAGIVGRVAAWAAGVPVIIHHVHGWGLRPSMSRLVRSLYINLERLCARLTTRLIVVCGPDIGKGLAYHIGTPDKFTLIHNGVPLKAFKEHGDGLALRSELGLDPTHKLVGMIGRLDEQKNPEDFIRTAAVVSKRYPEVQFLIVGDGPLRPQCESLIDELGLQGKVFLLGYRNDVPEIMSMLTLTAMTSLWEGLPIAFLEAMGAGKPIVANDVDGVSDVVVDGETGFLVQPRQPTQMAERILWLLTNPVLCNEIGQTAQERSEYFSIDRMAESIEDLYIQLA